MAKKKKIKIPKSVLDLRMSPKKYAKKHNIKISGKHLSKREKKRNIKRLKNEYSEAAINGLDKAVKILAENDESRKKIIKVKEGVENIITSPTVMKKVAKIYRKNPKQYQNMIYLPYMIMNTIEYYSSEGLSEEEKAEASNLDTEMLIEFCQKILKKEIKNYGKYGLDDEAAFHIAYTIPTSKLFENNKQWYRKLIQTMYVIATSNEVDVDTIFKAVLKIDKKKGIKKKDFYEGFYSEFIMQKSTNKTHTFTATQKELHEELIQKCLNYLNDLKSSKLRMILKNYIKRRKIAESYKNDTKRIIKFTDHANSNSPYATIKEVVQDLISDNSANELYLS